MLRGVLASLLAVLVVGASASAAVAQPAGRPESAAAATDAPVGAAWKVVVLIYGKTDVTYPAGGSSHRVVASMTQAQLEDAATTIGRFPATIATSSGRAVAVDMTVLHPSRPIGTVSPTAPGSGCRPKTCKRTSAPGG